MNEDQVTDVELVDDFKDMEESEIVSTDVVSATEGRIMEAPSKKTSKKPWTKK